MKETLVKGSILLTIAVAVAGSVLIHNQQQEIAAEKAEINRLKERWNGRISELVARSLSIVDDTGKVVVSIDSASGGGSVRLEARSPSGQTLSTARLFADPKDGVALKLFNNSATKANGSDHSANYTADGYLIQNWIGEKATASATLSVAANVADQSLTVDKLGGISMESGGGEVTFTKQKKKALTPARISVFAMSPPQLPSTNPTVSLEVVPNEDGTASAGIRLSGSKGMFPQSYFTDDSISFWEDSQNKASASLGVTSTMGMLSLTDDKNNFRFLTPSGFSTNTTDSNPTLSQQGAFKAAVDAEQDGRHTIFQRISLYMGVIAMDPDSAFGKAASTRVTQLEKTANSVFK